MVTANLLIGAIIPKMVEPTPVKMLAVVLKAEPKTLAIPESPSDFFLNLSAASALSLRAELRSFAASSISFAEPAAPLMADVMSRVFLAAVGLDKFSLMVCDRSAWVDRCLFCSLIALVISFSSFRLCCCNCTWTDISAMPLII